MFKSPDLSIRIDDYPSIVNRVGTNATRSVFFPAVY